MDGRQRLAERQCRELRVGARATAGRMADRRRCASRRRVRTRAHTVEPRRQAACSTCRSMWGLTGSNGPTLSWRGPTSSALPCHRATFACRRRGRRGVGKSSPRRRMRSTRGRSRPTDDMACGMALRWRALPRPEAQGTGSAMGGSPPESSGQGRTHRFGCRWLRRWLPSVTTAAVEARRTLAGPWPRPCRCSQPESLCCSGPEPPRRRAGALTVAGPFGAPPPGPRTCPRALRPPGGAGRAWWYRQSARHGPHAAPRHQPRSAPRHRRARLSPPAAPPGARRR